MKRKLIALDMDGTVIENGNQFSEKTIEVLSKLVKAGHEVVFSTGRPVRSIAPYYEAIGCKSLIIAYNGLWIHRPNELGKVPGYAFKKEVIQEIYNKIKDRISSFEAESETKIYGSEHNEYLDLFFPYKGMEKIISDNLIFEEDLLTVVILPKKGEQQFVFDVINSFEGYGYRPWTASDYGEMYRVGFNKGSGVRQAQKMLNIKKEDTIAIGDSDNDYEMLSEAGMPFAMKSSKSKRLLSSFRTTDFSLKEDGAALMLEKLLLKD